MHHVASTRFLLASCLALGLILALPTAGFSAEPAGKAAVDQGVDLGLPMAKPESVGLSSKRLERVSAAMQGYVDRQEVAGAVALIARRGKVAYLETFGERDAEADAAMTADTIFRIASMTKPIASVALMQLWEEGHFQLRDPISKYLPEFADMKVAVKPGQGEYVATMYKPVQATNAITFQHVLTHTAGLANSYRGPTRPDYVSLRTERQPDWTVGDYLSKLAELPSTSIRVSCGNTARQPTWWVDWWR